MTIQPSQDNNSIRTPPPLETTIPRRSNYNISEINGWISSPAQENSYASDVVQEREKRDNDLLVGTISERLPFLLTIPKKDTYCTIDGLGHLRIKDLIQLALQLKVHEEAIFEYYKVGEKDRVEDQNSVTTTLGKLAIFSELSHSLLINYALAAFLNQEYDPFSKIHLLALIVQKW